MEKTCPVCGDKFTGRIDKKFCSDQCRNTFNNSQNRDETNYMRNVNGMLRRNRKILSELNPGGKAKTTKQKLLESGFNFNYFTNIYTTKTGKQYFFCYEQGYLTIENDMYALVIKEDYVE